MFLIGHLLRMRFGQGKMALRMTIHMDYASTYTFQIIEKPPARRLRASGVSHFGRLKDLSSHDV
jgi:hypothetical protein